MILLIALRVAGKLREKYGDHDEDEHTGSVFTILQPLILNISIEEILPLKIRDLSG